MKKVILIALILTASGSLMAQNSLNTPPVLQNGNFTQPFKVDTSWRNNTQQFTDSNKILQQLALGKLDDFKTNKLINASPAITYSPVDHMPLVNFKGNDKIPSVSLKGNDRMPVIGIPELKKKVNP